MEKPESSETSHPGHRSCNHTAHTIGHNHTNCPEHWYGEGIQLFHNVPCSHHKETSDHGTPHPTNPKVHSPRHTKPLKVSAPSIPGSQTYLQVRDGTLRVQSQLWVRYLPCFDKYTLWCHNQGYGHLGYSHPLKSVRGSILVVDLKLF